MAFSLSSAIIVMQKQSKAEAFENVYNSLDYKGLRDPKKEHELCRWCGRGWKCLVYDNWCRIAESSGWNPADLRSWSQLLALYDRLRRSHERVCKREAEMALEKEGDRRT